MNTENKHERDDNIIFEPDGHTYIVNNQKSYISVTTFVKTLFKPFNADATIKRMKSSTYWNPAHKHYGKTDEEIKTEWTKVGLIASQQGTGLHQYIDDYLNDKLTDEPQIIEWLYFKNFMATLKGTKYRTEWTIYDEENQICGTLDFLVKNDDGTYTLIDWKRTKSLYQPKTDTISNLTYWHYTLQLNTYKYILEKHYGIIVSKMLIVQMHPGMSNYKVFNIPDRQSNIIRYLQERKNKKNGYFH